MSLPYVRQVLASYIRCIGQLDADTHEDAFTIRYHCIIAGWRLHNDAKAGT
jgi:hypothetical protein